MDILGKAGSAATLRWAATPQGLTMTFRADGPGAVEVRHAAVRESWPADAKPLPARPRNVMPFDISDSTIVTGSAKLAW